MHTRVGSSFFLIDMPNNNLPLSVTDQITLLKGRGLVFNDEISAAHFLFNNNFYRLKSYMHIFHAPDKHFLKNIFFEDILELYHFDRDLRSLIFNATEEIEIAFRTQIISQYSMSYGGHWYLDEIYFRNHSLHFNFLEKLYDNIESSTEDFMVPYKKQISVSSCWMVPACWISFEVMSFRQLSMLYQNLYRNDKCKKDVAVHFGIKSPLVLENWMHCMSLIRNICAHHGRLWNRTIPKNIELLNSCSEPFIQISNIRTDKIYAYICCMLYLLNKIEPQNNFKLQLFKLFEKYPSTKLNLMGFPQGWESEPLWKI
ncbi:hypothetical protein MsAm2_02510 [Methanolapillus ohkumae]|uniref:Abi family protein n=2 Tax=Methanolapillus ohkumae TaxID=3028298 RepID=A0AA96V4P7_9EURY|nr:hypothetical protein MsAm2_02510 [Methanosarcinaceae archaeon Am2]